MASSGTYATLDNNNLIGIFDQLYDGALNKLWSAGIATPMDSNSETETYGWLGAAPSLVELKGEAKAEDGFKAFTYALRNKEYARAISIRDVDMRRDKIGQITARIGEMAEKAAEHWDALTAAAIIANGTGYDSVAMYSASHPESGTNQSNLLTASDYSGLNVGTAATPTIAEVTGFLPQLLGHFATFTDDKGDPMNGSAKSYTVLCGTVPIFAALNGALTSVNVTDTNGMRTNPVQGFIGDGYSVRAVLTPRLSTVTDAIYICRNDGSVKPFIHQTEVALDSQMTDRNSDEWKKYRRYLFSIYTSRAVGYGRWQGTLKATLS